MDEPSAEDLLTSRELALLSGAAPYIEDALAKQEQSVQNWVFHGLRDHSLTPQDALSAWQEVAVIRKLRARLIKKVT